MGLNACGSILRGLMSLKRSPVYSASDSTCYRIQYFTYINHIARIFIYFSNWDHQSNNSPSKKSPKKSQVSKKFPKSPIFFEIITIVHGTYMLQKPTGKVASFK